MARRPLPFSISSRAPSISFHPAYIRFCHGQWRQEEPSMAWISAWGSPSAGMRKKPRRVVFPTERMDLAMGLAPRNS